MAAFLIPRVKQSKFFEWRIWREVGPMSPTVNALDAHSDQEAGVSGRDIPGHLRKSPYESAASNESKGKGPAHGRALHAMTRCLSQEGQLRKLGTLRWGAAGALCQV